MATSSSSVHEATSSSAALPAASSTVTSPKCPSPSLLSSTPATSTFSTFTPVTVDDLIEMATATTISSPGDSLPNSAVVDENKVNPNTIREAQYFSEIIPNLFLTSANHITDENLVTFKITHVVNATRTVPLKRSVKSLRVNILDSQYEKINAHFDAVSDFIHDALKNKNRVAVHCISGISRSSTLVIAFLMKHKDMMLKDAFNLVRSKRWFIRPNTGFFRQLVEYENQLYGINTVKMVWSEAAGAHVPDFILEDSSNYKYFYMCIKK